MQQRRSAVLGEAKARRQNIALLEQCYCEMLKRFPEHFPADKEQKVCRICRTFDDWDTGRAERCVRCGNYVPVNDMALDGGKREICNQCKANNRETPCFK